VSLHTGADVKPTAWGLPSQALTADRSCTEASVQPAQGTLHGRLELHKLL